MEKILVAPCAYKGSLSPSQLALAIEAGIVSAGAGHTIVKAPLADGGDGTIEAIYMACGGNIEHIRVSGALGARHDCAWLCLGDTAIVELACACGLGLLDERALRPLEAHTFGLGEVIKHCLKNQYKEIVVCVGGSASTDGGTGALAALGARFLDENGKELPLGGGALLQLTSCYLGELYPVAGLRVAVDVTSPLVGERGAACTFAPQKGATADQVALLERALTNLANVMEAKTKKRVRDLPGAGAAGGTAFGLACALSAEIISGFNWIADITRLDEKIAQCDIVITAEGRLDETSLSGKAIGELAKKCREHDKPLWVVPALVDSQPDWAKYGIKRVAPSSNGSRPATASDVSAAVKGLF